MTDPFKGVVSTMTPAQEVSWWMEALDTTRTPEYIRPSLEFTVGRCTVHIEAVDPYKPFTVNMSVFKPLLTGKSSRARRAVFTRCPKFVALPGPGNVDTRVAKAWRTALDTGRWAG